MEKISIWSEEQIKQYTRDSIRLHFYDTASVIAGRSYYFGCDWRYEKLRAIIAQEIQVFKQHHNPEEKKYNFFEKGEWFSDTEFFQVTHSIKCKK